VPLCALLASPAAAGLADRTVQPMLLPVGNAELKVDALAAGAVLAADQPGEDKQATGVAKLMPRLHRDYDSGMVVSLNGTFTLADPLSRGRYTNPIEKLFGELQTGLGRVQVGLADGAGYALGLTGPKASSQIALEDAQISFFRDPVTIAPSPACSRCEPRWARPTISGRSAISAPFCSGCSLASPSHPARASNCPS